MKYTPEHKTKGTNITAAVLFAVAGATYCASVSGLPYPGFLQIAALCAIVAAIYILVRYKFTSVVYEISPRGTAAESVSDYDLTVSKAQGKRAYIKECVMSLGDLEAVFPLKDGRLDRTEVERRHKAYKTYYYTVNMKPRGLSLVFDDGRDVSVIVIEPDEKTEAFLISAAEKNGRGSDEKNY